MGLEHIDVMDDASKPLSWWKAQIEALIEQFGEEAVLAVDGGHNNVEFTLES